MLLAMVVLPNLMMTIPMWFTLALAGTMDSKLYYSSNHQSSEISQSFQRPVDLVTKLYPQEDASGAVFGHQIAVSDAYNLLFISSVDPNQLRGRVEVFRAKSEPGSHFPMNNNFDDDSEAIAIDNKTLIPFQGSFSSCSSDQFGVSIATPSLSSGVETDDRTYVDFAQRPPLLYVGAPASDKFGPESGEVYLFTIPELPLPIQQPCPIVSATPVVANNPHAKFGSSVSALGSYLLVGAPNQWRRQSIGPIPPVAGPNVGMTGAAYLFHCLGPKCSQLQELAPMQGGSMAQFGCEVQLIGDIAVISACGDSSYVLLGGSVYLYLFDADKQQLEYADILVPSDLQINAQFGHSIAFSQRRGVVAAFEEVTSADWITQRKVLYVFGRVDTFVRGSAVEGIDISVSKQWNLVAKIRSPLNDGRDLFGASLAIYRDSLIVVGAPGANGGSGVIHIYGSTAQDNAPASPGNRVLGVEDVGRVIFVSGHGTNVNSNSSKTKMWIGESWKYLANLTSVDYSHGDAAAFGSALATWNDTLIVTAPGLLISRPEDDLESGSVAVARQGVAYVEWNLLVRLKEYYNAQSGLIETEVPAENDFQTTANAVILLGVSSAVAVAVIMYLSSLRMGCLSSKKKKKSDTNTAEEDFKESIPTTMTFKGGQTEIPLKDLQSSKFTTYTVDSDDDDDDDDLSNFSHAEGAKRSGSDELSMIGAVLSREKVATRTIINRKLFHEGQAEDGCEGELFADSELGGSELRVSRPSSRHTSFGSGAGSGLGSTSGTITTRCSTSRHSSPSPSSGNDYQLDPAMTNQFGKASLRRSCDVKTQADALPAGGRGLLWRLAGGSSRAHHMAVRTEESAHDIEQLPPMDIEALGDRHELARRTAHSYSTASLSDESGVADRSTILQNTISGVASFLGLLKSVHGKSPNFNDQPDQSKQHSPSAAVYPHESSPTVLHVVTNPIIADSPSSFSADGRGKRTSTRPRSVSKPLTTTPTLSAIDSALYSPSIHRKGKMDVRELLLSRPARASIHGSCISTAAAEAGRERLFRKETCSASAAIAVASAIDVEQSRPATWASQTALDVAAADVGTTSDILPSVISI